jgi:hypothetical protein
MTGSFLSVRVGVTITWWWGRRGNRGFRSPPPVVNGLHGHPAGSAEAQPDRPVVAGVAPVRGARGTHVLQGHGNLDALFPVHRRTRLDQDRFGFGEVADKDVARRVEQQQARAAGGGEPMTAGAWYRFMYGPGTRFRPVEPC